MFNSILTLIARLFAFVIAVFAAFMVLGAIAGFFFAPLYTGSYGEFTASILFLGFIVFLGRVLSLPGEQWFSSTRESATWFARALTFREVA